MADRLIVLPAAQGDFEELSAPLRESVIRRLEWLRCDSARQSGVKPPHSENAFRIRCRVK
jgi:hypothetical protein